MCMMGKYFLTEDESILLGCMKTQSESGDYNSQLHTLENLTTRIKTRFPNPIRDKMRALTSNTISGNKLSEDIAIRVQSIYLRLAGKTKNDAQINFLEFLSNYCPFYGSSFFDIQSQYDDNPLDDNSSPPVIPMVVAIGPLALFLITKDSTTIMRQPYNIIVKWICHADKHIFTYWVLLLLLLLF